MFVTRGITITTCSVVLWLWLRYDRSILHHLSCYDPCAVASAQHVIPAYRGGCFDINYQNARFRRIDNSDISLHLINWNAKNYLCTVSIELYPFWFTFNNAHTCETPGKIFSTAYTRERLRYFFSCLNLTEIQYSSELCISTLSYDIILFRVLKILFYKTCFARALVVSFHELLKAEADSIQDFFILTFSAKLLKECAP
jgi:hypothetical protein